MSAAPYRDAIFDLLLRLHFHLLAPAKRALSHAHAGANAWQCDLGLAGVRGVDCDLWSQSQRV